MNVGCVRFVSACLLVITLALWTGGVLCPSASAADQVRIGLAAELTGNFKDLAADMRDGFSLYMEQVGNKAGGRNIEVIVRDIGANDPSLALDVVKRLVEEDRIDILTGVITSGSAYALARLVQKRNIPFVISNAGADDLTQRESSPLIVRPSFTNSSGGHPLGAWAYEQGYRNAAVIGSDFVAGYEQVGGILRNFHKAGGRVVQEIWAPIGTQDFRPFLSQIQPDVDVVVAFFAGGDALRFVTQYAEMGLKDKIPVIGKGILEDENLLPKMGGAVDGIVSVLHWSPYLSTSECTDFCAAYRAKYGRTATMFAEQGYVSAMLIAEGLKKTGGQVKGADFVKVLRGIELKAPRGPVKFDSYGAPVQAFHLIRGQQVDGQWRSVVFKSYPAVSQFWDWAPEEFMKMPPYAKMKGQWAK